LSKKAVKDFDQEQTRGTVKTEDVAVSTDSALTLLDEGRTRTRLSSVVEHQGCPWTISAFSLMMAKLKEFHPKKIAN
jgi:hypothetical protein